VNRRGAFHVERAAPVNKPVAKLTAEGRYGPTCGVSHHHIRVAQQDQRPLAAVAANACIKIRSSRCNVENTSLDTVRFENFLYVTGHREFVSGWIGGVNANQLLEQLHCFSLGLRPIDIS